MDSIPEPQVFDNYLSVDENNDEVCNRFAALDKFVLSDPTTEMPHYSVPLSAVVRP